MDLLKSALEINHKASHPALRHDGKSSENIMHRGRADSAPKLNNAKHISSHPGLSAVVDEVSSFVRLCSLSLFNTQQMHSSSRDRFLNRLNFHDFGNDIIRAACCRPQMIVIICIII